MPDYKEMYLKLFRATEQAIEILIEAQRECEELYIESKEPELVLIKEEKDGGTDCRTVAGTQPLSTSPENESS